MSDRALQLWCRLAAARGGSGVRRPGASARELASRAGAQGRATDACHTPVIIPMYRYAEGHAGDDRLTSTRAQVDHYAEDRPLGPASGACGADERTQRVAPADLRGGVVRRLGTSQPDPAVVRDQGDPVAVARVTETVWNGVSPGSIGGREPGDRNARAVCPISHNLLQSRSVVPQRWRVVRLTARPFRSRFLPTIMERGPKRAPPITGRQLPRADHRRVGGGGWLARRLSVSAGRRAACSTGDRPGLAP
jgi:hypothetical protein